MFETGWFKYFDYIEGEFKSLCVSYDADKEDLKINLQKETQAKDLKIDVYL
jgi:hypothetical protein